MKVYKKMALLMIIVLGLTSLLGCDKNNIMEEPEENIVEAEEEDIDLLVSGKDHDLLIRSENVSNLVVDLYGIDDVSSIIFNDIVVVAVEMGADNTLTDDVKEMIMETVLNNDKAIRQVLITNDKKVFDQIEDIIEDLMHGKPYDNYVKEINRLIEKLKK